MRDRARRHRTEYWLKMGKAGARSQRHLVSERRAKPAPTIPIIVCIRGEGYGEAHALAANFLRRPGCLVQADTNSALAAEAREWELGSGVEAQDTKGP